MSIETTKEMQILDTGSAICPEPIMLLYTQLRRMLSGQQLKFITSDSMTSKQVPALCLHLGHTLISSKQTNNGCYHFILMKKQSS